MGAGENVLGLGGLAAFAASRFLLASIVPKRAIKAKICQTISPLVD